MVDGDWFKIADRKKSLPTRETVTVSVKRLECPVDEI